MQINLQAMRRQDVPLHAEVAAVLRHQIRTGELSQGTKLPALRELTESLGVARMTIIQAMNTLEEEGLIERHSGRGTFVKKVPIPDRYKLQMHADISQIYAMVSQLKVDVESLKTDPSIQQIDGDEFHVMERTHLMHNKPFCYVNLKLASNVFDMAPDRFVKEIAVSVMEDLGINVQSAKQRITMSYADFKLAKALDITVNAAVFRVAREFFDESGKLIYSALLTYPGELLELEIDFRLQE